MKRNEQDEWFVFNREYVPPGHNENKDRRSLDEGGIYANLPVYTKYRGLTEAKILKIISDPTAIQRDKEGRIEFVWFYRDATNPQTHPQYWERYFEIIKALSAFMKK